MSDFLYTFLIASFFFLFLPPQNFSQNPTDLNIEGLVGKVKRIEEKSSELKVTNGISKETSRIPTRTVIFNKNGQINYEWKKIGTLPPFEQFYTFKDGRRYKRTLRNDLGINATRPLESFSISIFNYNSAENSITEEVFVGNDPVVENKTQKYKYTFDISGKILEQILYSKNDVPVIRMVYLYDSERLPTERHLGAANGRSKLQIFKYKYELDSFGNWIKQIAENNFADEKGTKRTEITYRKIEYYK